MIKDDKLVDTDFNLYIGKRLKKYRLEHNLSLLALAKKLNNKILAKPNSKAHKKDYIS